MNKEQFTPGTFDHLVETWERVYLHRFGTDLNRMRNRLKQLKEWDFGFQKPGDLEYDAKVTALENLLTIERD